MAVEGVDYAWDRPTVAGLVAAGKKFACRYGGPGSAGKQLDPTEATALNAAGVSIVANAEGAANGMNNGFNAGVDWARQAIVHFRNCGMPDNRPIYFSADFDVSATTWPNVRAALLGAASIVGAGRVGIYGGYDPVRWAARDGVAAWFWQTFAWSEGRWFAGNHIEQYQNHVSLAGGTVDLNRALAADFGQWGVGDMATPAEVWSYLIGSASLNMPPTPAADWLKQGLAALREARAVNAELDTVRAKLDEVLAAIAAGLTPEQLNAVRSAAAAGGTAGAYTGVDKALDGATITTTIDVAAPTP